MTNPLLGPDNFRACDDPEAEAVYWLGAMQRIFGHQEPTADQLRAALFSRESVERKHDGVIE